MVERERRKKDMIQSIEKESNRKRINRCVKDEKNYNAIRVNADFNVVMKNLEYYIDYCKKRGTSFSITPTIIKQNCLEKSYFFSGYDCDSLAFDGVTNFVESFLPIFEKNKNGILEIRTKSIQIQKILKHKPIDNCIIASNM